MASSQPATSSPARSAVSQDDRFALSPQSRLKQLLATVDSDSDEDNTSKVTVRQGKFSRHLSPSRNRINEPAVPASSEDEDGDDITLPRGRLAGHMQVSKTSLGGDARERVRKLLEKGAAREQSNVATAADVEKAAAVGDVDDSADDLSRPRGKLASRMQGATRPSGDNVTKRASRSPPKSPAPAQSADDAEDVEMADDDEDEDVHVRSRKPRSRQQQSATPEPTIMTPRKVTSPGLFVTPSKSPPSAQESPNAASGSDDDLPALKSDRFKALVEKKRKERLAREAEEARKKEARAAALEDLGDDNNDDVSDISDDEGGRRLTQTQKPRPSRKASKKALEDMNRETQRMQRAMQLAHEAKTKKKITKASLFERFNFKAAGTAPAKESSSRPQTPTSMKSTDVEMQDADTPPSSPPARVEDVLGKDLKGVQTEPGAATPMQAATTKEALGRDGNDELPEIMDIQAFARKPLNVPTTPAQGSAKTAPKRQVRVKLAQMQANRVSLSSNDEDELVVVNPRKSKLDAIFDRVPMNNAKESSSLRLLRRLAHLDSPERKAYKKVDKSAMTPGELQALLQQRAREQAKLERERRMEMLKAKGIHIQTEEERQRDREQVEDMVARARREAEEIMDRERDEAKKEKRAKGSDPLAWDESGSDDDDYEENSVADDAEDEADLPLSGSEEEEVEEDEEDVEDNVEGMIIDDDEDGRKEADAVADLEETPKKAFPSQNLVSEAAVEASESETSETEQSWVDPDEEDERHRWGVESDADTPDFVQARRPKKLLGVVPDDEDLGVGATPKAPKTQAINFTPRPVTAQAFDPMTGLNKDISPEVPTSVLRSAAKTFIPGLPVDAGGPAGLGLTQIFAGTMDDSQPGPGEGSPSQPMPTFDHFPDSQSSPIASDGMVLDSQTVPATEAGTQETQVRLDFTQSQTHGLDSLLRDDLASQASQLMDPTQDDGFRTWTPLKERFVEPAMSTMSTVESSVRGSSQIDEMTHESPLLQKRGRLRRKVVIASDSEDEDDIDFVTKPSAFNILKDAAAREEKRKVGEDFNKKKSKAKEMVFEQAEESEDEYAGLGGVDGEDSDDDDAASVQEMIDDQTQGNREEDEAKISALYAERERVEDAKQTDKLFHDITRGMLRRKRGTDYDLSDSDDGGEARRRMKRRQFAKMQKALFTDERISKVAENPRNQAFMRTIEDIGSDEEMDFLFEPAPQADKNTQPATWTVGGESQENVIVPDSQPGADHDAQQAKRAPAAERRTKNGRKPASLGEIRETLSSLLDEPSGNTVVSATDAGSESEGQGEGDASDSGSDDGSSSNKENANPRRRKHAGAVVDRISLKRQGSSNISSGGGGGGGAGRMAFAAPSSGAAGASGGFKVPALLRKATTNSLMSVGGPAGSSSGGSTAGGSGGGFGDEGKIKKNAGKRSGISYLARENDRRAKLAEAERRREEKKYKAVKGRGKAVGGLFGAGRFE